jgi:hypothetical protein
MKGLSGTNILAYFASSLVTNVRSLIVLTIGDNAVKLSSSPMKGQNKLERFIQLTTRDNFMETTLP